VKAGKPEEKEGYNLFEEDELKIYVDNYFTVSRMEITYYPYTGGLSVKTS